MDPEHTARPACHREPPAAWEPRAGIGLKAEHVRALLDERPPIGFVEVHAENYMVAGGPLHHWLGRVREHYELSLHGVGLSIGGEEPLDEDHLDRLAALIDRYRPASFSEHLAWSSHGGTYFNDLLPLPYDDATLDRICAQVQRVQERLGLRVLIENPATYVEFTASTMSEAQFIGELVRRTGCGLLLDVNNAYVSCVNHRRDPWEFIARLPLHAVGEIHLAGFAREYDAAGAPLLIDSHGTPVDDAVWALYARVIGHLGPVPTLLERDRDVPSLPVLVAEALRAEAAMRQAAAGGRARPGGRA